MSHTAAEAYPRRNPVPGNPNSHPNSALPYPNPTHPPHSPVLSKHSSTKSSAELPLSPNTTTTHDPEKQPSRNSDPDWDNLPEYERARRGRWAHKKDPFADEAAAGGEDEVKYRSMRWWQGGMIMIAETISLGILSLPSVLARVGLVPGVILIIGMGLLATYTGYVLWQFKMAYPHVHNMADAGEIIAGRIGREIGGAAQTIFLIFSMGSHLLTFMIAMNAITGHATCTIVWGIVGLVIFWLFTLPRTLKKVSYLSIASFISICGAVFITMIGVGVSPSPNLHLNATVSTSLAKAFLSVSNIIFAYAGHVAFFSFISEFKDPMEFPKALYLLQFTDTMMYLIVAVVVYRYTGMDVKSPALGSTGPVVMKVAYGIALPTILIAGVIYGHVASKYVFVRLFRGTAHLTSRSLFSFLSWGGITLTFWVIAWVIAESIPNFNNLLALISALFASWFTFGLSGIFWLYMNKGRYGLNWKKMALTALNVVVVCIGTAVCGIGLWSSGKAIKNESGSSSWTCADTSKLE